MRNELVQIQYPSTHTIDSCWPRVPIPIDEFEVDLVIILARVRYNQRQCPNMGRYLTSARDRCMNGMLFITGFPTPIIISVPPLRTEKAAVQTLLSTPVHSITDAGAVYSPSPYNFRISLAFSSAFNFSLIRYIWVCGTNSLAKLRRPWSMSVITSG